MKTGQKGEVVAFGQGRARCYRIADISSVVDIGVERDLSEPDPLRLTYRSVIKHAVRAVVLSTKGDQLDIIQTFVTKNVVKARLHNNWAGMIFGTCFFKKEYRMTYQYYL